MSDIHPQGHEPQGSSAHSDHERTDVRLKPIIAFGVGLIVMAIVVQLTLAYFMSRFEVASRKARALEPTLYRDLRGQFSAPNTPVAPRTKLAEHRALERKVLDSYGWTDRKAGTARVPIDRALDILAERGLPKVKNIAPNGARSEARP